MRRLFITGFGKFGRQAVDELRQENHLNQVVVDFIDLAAGKSIGKDAVWIILGSLAEVSAMGEDSSIMHAFRFASAKGILMAVSLADGSQEKNLQAYDRLSIMGVHMLVLFTAKRLLNPIKEIAGMLNELFASKWIDGIIRIDLTDVQELLLTSECLYFGESGSVERVKDYCQAVCLACAAAFPEQKIAEPVHAIVLLEGFESPTAITSISQGIERIGDYCDNYSVTLSVCESDIESYHAAIFAGV